MISPRFSPGIAHFAAAVMTVPLLVGDGVSAAESADQDKEQDAVRQGALGTINVLRDLDPRTFVNRVVATCNVAGEKSTPADTIDGSGTIFRPKIAATAPLVFIYTLPGMRTVSSLAICYGYAHNDAPAFVALEGSSDGGRSWTPVFRAKARKTEFIKAFTPVAVNALRLTQEGDGTPRSGRSTREVFVYAEPTVPLGWSGGTDGGTFSFLRNLWYAGKIVQRRSPASALWVKPYGGKSHPHVPFQSAIVNFHDGAWGAAEPYSKDEPGKRLHLCLDLDRAYAMNHGLISTADAEHILARKSKAEIYTGPGGLDPGRLTGNSPEEIVKAGWVLQQAWANDDRLDKSFALRVPGRYCQILLVWDCVHATCTWSRLEMFGVDGPVTPGTTKTP